MGGVQDLLRQDPRDVGVPAVGSHVSARVAVHLRPRQELQQLAGAREPDSAGEERTRNRPYLQNTPHVVCTTHTSSQSLAACRRGFHTLSRLFAANVWRLMQVGDVLQDKNKDVMIFESFLCPLKEHDSYLQSHHLPNRTFLQKSRVVLVMKPLITT